MMACFNRAKIALPLEPPAWLRALHGAPRALFSQRLNQMHDTVALAMQDGIAQVIAILLVTESDVPNLRCSLGKATWRKIHHASAQTNFMRSLIWLKYQDKAEWSEIVDLPETHLRSCRNAVDWETAKLAASLAAPGRFAQTAMLYRDVIRMGGDSNQHWSLPKLKRAHARLSVRSAIASADPTPWEAPFSFEEGGYAFSSLCSDRDFVAEGKTLRHCVATYREDAQNGRALVMRCTGRERATVKFDRHGNMEIGGFANAPVSDSCRHAADSARRAYLAERAN